MTSLNPIQSLAPTNIITKGQGEYIVFNKSVEGSSSKISRKIFKKAYDVLSRYSPIKLIEQGETLATCANRDKLIKREIKKIDPKLGIAFVPRTLYELIFIRECIKSDMKKQKRRPYLSKTEYKEKRLSQSFIRENRNRSWYLAYFRNEGDDQHIGVKSVAYRLNNIIIKTLQPENKSFEYQKLIKFTDEVVKFLQKYSNEIKNEIDNLTPMEIREIKLKSSHRLGGPTSYFAMKRPGYNHEYHDMRINTDEHVEILHNALALDCSELAHRSLFLYRGANFDKDSPFTLNQKHPYSLSFGTSLFAGVVHDGGATPWRYARLGKNNAYAIPVPFDQIASSPFYIPSTRTVSQLFGDREVFHSRTKVWKEYDIEEMVANGEKRGILGDVDDKELEILKSNLEKDELASAFQHYKNQAIQLKSLKKT